eukprot:CAMPEP_0179054808 /NCGR_PEP_ID=MMETSP0796-20121207/22977_1 /TAXON_ID=73915 /ORGANISM="Pyrodinium bahamense, Strain pbaha01" /LENGTH=563 /DNA_ID=CAMNT_0020751443 /DNA_START=103 /DNA_END=1792 /DNA_ORIENTATION=-
MTPGTSDEPSTYCIPQLLSRYSDGWPRTLDVGIYWFGHGDATQKAVSGGKSLFYDPTKPTVIYFHGWAGSDEGWTKVCKRPTTRCPSAVCHGGHTLLMERWLDDGWNVGFFYWDQFADEDCSRDAEQKIWFDRKGDGLQWKSFDIGLQRTQDNVYEEAASVAELCEQNIMMAMGQYSGHHVRFVGHSIGAQLATRCAAKLHHRGHPAAPQRLALLEPYFSKHQFGFLRCKHISTDSGLGDYTAAATTVIVRSLWDQYKVVTEVYKSSVMTEHKAFGIPNEDLEKLGTLVRYKPHWCGGLGALSSLKMLANLDIMHLNCRHDAVFPLYFLSYGQSAPPVIPAQLVGQAQPGSAISTCSTPSAMCTDGEIREWVERQFAVEGSQEWTQASGTDTISSSDDAFKLEPGLQDEVDPAGIANLGVMKTALSDAAIYAETHQTPWWRDLHSGSLQLFVVAASAALLGLMGGSLIACQANSSDDVSDDESESELASRSLSASNREKKVLGSSKSRGLSVEPAIHQSRCAEVEEAAASPAHELQFHSVRGALRSKPPQLQGPPPVASHEDQ